MNTADSGERARSLAPIRLALADDHQLVRAGLKLLFSTMEGIQVVGEAGSGRELVQLVEALEPELVVTDISMPDGDGLTAIEALKLRWPQIRVIAMSMYDTPDFVRQAVRLGAAGYVLKGASPVEMEHAVRSVMRGGNYFSPEVSARLAAAVEPRAEELLTKRQLEVLLLIARGMSAKEIGFELGLSAKTVHVHRSAIMTRLQINDIASLTLYAVRHRLVDPTDTSLRAATARR